MTDIPWPQDTNLLAPEAAATDEILSALGTSRAGLDPAEAGRRLAAIGPNALPPAARRSSALRFLDQFRNVLVYVLLPPAILAVTLGHWLDAAVIVAVVVANAVVGWLQEGRAEEALAAVGRLIPAQAVAMRSGARTAMPAADLVPGDVVLLESGDRIPADVRLVDVHSLSVDESLLTGESLPVAKQGEPVSPGLPLAERQSMGFSGTIVTGGQALGVVVATGGATELGRISRLVGSVQDLVTPFLRKLARLSRQLTIAILAVALFTLGVGLAIGVLPVSELLLAAVGFAVAAIPEGLPAIVTIVLAIGVRRMAGRGALIRRLPAVETLGSVTVICTDKTGTLTRNELVATEVATPGGRYLVEGDGYAPTGRIAGGEGDGGIADLLRTAVLCNDGRLREIDGRWIAEGDPIEAALLALGAKGGIAAEAARAAAPRLDLLPFESEHRYMASLNAGADGATIHVKGAPERVLQLCGTNAADTTSWLGVAEAMAMRGLRVLAFAACAGGGSRHLAREELAGNLRFLGLVGFIDPPRTEAVEAITACRKAGIAVKMITGDHAATAIAVGREIGLDVSAGALTGAELALLDEPTFTAAAARTNIFARVEPVQKLRLVRALQQAGASVAMTGDGVNDAPALRQADIGVAMGRKGSDAAREAADMVLVDDNFATIANAVAEGRAVDDNLRKTLRYVLPTNAGEALLLIGAILAGVTLPITAVQIIWINFATEITLSLSLAFEPRSDGAMLRRPRSQQTPLIARHDVARIVIVALLMAGVAGGLFAFGLANGDSVEAARAMAVNAVVAAEIGYLLVMATVLPARRGGPVNRVAAAMIVVVSVLQVAVTTVPPIAAALGMAPIGLRDWALVVLAGFVVYLVTRLALRLGGRLLDPQT